MSNCTFSLTTCLPLSVDSYKPCTFLSHPPLCQVPSVCFHSLSRSALAPLSLTLLHCTLTLPGIPSMSIPTHDPLLTCRASAHFQGSFPTPLFLLFLPSAQSGFLWLCALLFATQEQSSPGPSVGVHLLLYIRDESPRNGGGTQGEHLRKCSSGTVGKMHTSPQAPWHLGHPHSAAGCAETNLLRSFGSQVCILNKTRKLSKSLQLISSVITASAGYYWSPIPI